jgi:pimeloyl-ACP methyl ester carboxylesterase
MHEEAVVLGDLIAALEIRAPILVGHSDGASIALIHAALSTAATAPRALVLIAPHLFVEDRTIAAIAAARDAFATTDLCLRLGRRHRDPLRTFRGWNDVWLDPRFRGWDIRPLVERVVCPVLAIQGEADEYGTMAQLEELAARLPGPLTELRLPGCGHAPHREQPEAVVAAIAEFLAPLSARPAD